MYTVNESFFFKGNRKVVWWGRGEYMRMVGGHVLGFPHSAAVLSLRTVDPHTREPQRSWTEKQRQALTRATSSLSGLDHSHLGRRPWGHKERHHAVLPPAGAMCQVSPLSYSHGLRRLEAQMLTFHYDFSVSPERYPPPLINLFLGQWVSDHKLNTW